MAGLGVSALFSASVRPSDAEGAPYELETGTSHDENDEEVVADEEEVVADEEEMHDRMLERRERELLEQIECALHRTAPLAPA